MTTGDPSAPDSAEDAEVRLPDAVRQRVVALAADALPVLSVEDVPAPLRRFAQFTPARRARLAASALAAALATDPVFRHEVAARAVEAAGPLGTAVSAGTPPGAADPVEVAALAYLARPERWADLVRLASDAVSESADREELKARTREVDRLTEQLAKARTAAKVDVDRLGAELAAARAEAAQAKSRVRELTRALRAAEQEAQRAGEALSTQRGRAAAAASAADAEVRRLRARLAEVETELDAARRATREGRTVDNARLWLLLETLGQAAQGLRRELALGPPAQLPGDLVAASAAGAQTSRPEAPTWAAEDPSQLDQLLALPRVHLIVDGYNVTKSGFAELTLEQQRTRLVNGLGGLAAQTGAEVTVVFDGADRLPAAPPTPRGVRVLFSPSGQTADELIRRLVRAEPRGRPLLVVSSDREVADGVRRAGAHAVPAGVLVRRLERS